MSPVIEYGIHEYLLAVRFPILIVVEKHQGHSESYVGNGSMDVECSVNPMGRSSRRNALWTCVQRIVDIPRVAAAASCAPSTWTWTLRTRRPSRILTAIDFERSLKATPSTMKDNHNNKRQQISYYNFHELFFWTVWPSVIHSDTRHG